MSETTPLIGAHTSIAGGVHHALEHGASIGATTIQIFTSNQKQWKGRTFSQKDLDLWFKTLEETGMTNLMSHDSYLINLGSPNEKGLLKSRQAFSEEIERCLQLNLTFLNFHPGSYLKEEPQDCLDRIAESLLETEKQLKGHSLRLLLETTAGQGTNMGYKFKELGYIIDRVKDRIPIGVCIDTCHIFAAGYDIRDMKSWKTTLNDFEKHIGIKHLYALHVNDSMKELGSRRDRHAHIGEGEIGIEGFIAMMNHPALKDLPKYLETPGGLPVWVKEIEMLKSFIKRKKYVNQ